MFINKEDLYFNKADEIVYAIQVDLPNNINTARLHAFVDYDSIELNYPLNKITFNNLTMHTGEWLVKDFLGEKFTVVTDKEFKKNYRK